MGKFHRKRKAGRDGAAAGDGKPRDRAPYSETVKESPMFEGFYKVCCPGLMGKLA